MVQRPNFIRQITLSRGSQFNHNFSLTAESIACSNLFGSQKDRVNVIKENHLLSRKKHYARLSEDYRTSLLEMNGLNLLSVKDVPYADLSLQGLHLRKTLQMVQNDPVVVILAPKNGFRSSRPPIFLQNLMQSCKKSGVDSLIVNPLILRAALWSANYSGDINKFWLEGFNRTYQDILTRSFQKSYPLVIIGYHGLISDGDHMGQVLGQFQNDVKVLGARFNSSWLGGNSIKQILVNMNSPWVETGNDSTKGVASALKQLASYGLIRGSAGPNCVYITR